MQHYSGIKLVPEDNIILSMYPKIQLHSMIYFGTDEKEEEEIDLGLDGNIKL